MSNRPSGPKTPALIGGNLIGKAGHVGVQPTLPTMPRPNLGTGLPVSPITLMKRNNGVPGMKNGGSVGKSAAFKRGGKC